MNQSEPRGDADGENDATRRRSAIITGGASGIGRALAEALAGAGVHVWLADRQVELAEQVAADIRARGGLAAVTELDVRNAARFQAVVQTTVAQAGRLDYLFNNAGIAVVGEMREYAAADWDDVIAVNLQGVAHGILAAYPQMIRQGFGHIVNTASMAGLSPVALQGSYTATKHAVVALSRTLRVEAKRYGVKVSVLCPGAVRTPILEGGRYGRFTPGLDPTVFDPLLEQFRPTDPALLARRVLRAVERNRAIIIEPWWCHIVWHLERLSPWLMDRIIEHLLTRVRRDLEARGR